MRLIHGTALTLFLTLSAHAAIRVSPEIPLAAPTVAPQEGNQRPAAIATDGNQFLIAWTTDFTATGAYAGLWFAGINLALTDSDGHPLAKIKLPATEYAAGVSLCWTGSVYLASWIDYRQHALYTVAVSIDGKLLRQPTLLKQGVLGDLLLGGPSLCSNGRQTLLLYNDGALKAALLDAAGTAIKIDQPITASGFDTPYSDLVPHLASDGQDFVAVWRTEDRALRLGNFHLLPIRSNGEVTDPPIELGHLESNNGFGVSFGGGVVAITAIEFHLIRINDVQPRLVRFLAHLASRSVQRLAPVDLPKDYGIYASDASLFWNGRRFIAYWMEYTPASFVLRTLAFDTAGNDDGPPVRIASGERLAFLPLMGFNGRASLAVWNEVADVYFNRADGIYGSLFDASATRAASTDPPMLLSAAWSRQMVPSIATSDSSSLIVWVEETGGVDKGRLVGQRVAADGSVIDTTPFELARSAAIIPAPRVVFAGETFLVVWAEPSDNRVATTGKARSVSSDRSLGQTVSLGQASFSMAAASNGTMALVVSGERAYRFDARGRQIDIVPLVLNGIRYSPLAASNGTDFFVAWNQGTDHLQFNGPNLIDVFGLRVSAAGVVDATPLPIATGPADQVLAALVSDGRDYLVAFQIRGYSSTVVATKNVLREGVLEGFTASDTGTVVGNDVIPHGNLFALAGDRTGYWWISDVLVRTDLRGNRTSDAQPVGALISAAAAQVAGGPLRMVLSRRVAEGPVGGTVVRAIMRTAAEVSVARRRATRH